MTGSPLIPIVAPLVMLICLGIWIAIVFYADAHPDWKHRPGRSTGTARTGQQRTGLETAARHSASLPARPDTAASAAHQDAAEPAPRQPGRRAA